MQKSKTQTKQIAKHTQTNMQKNKRTKNIQQMQQTKTNTNKQ